MPSVKQAKNDIIYYLIRGLIALFDLLTRPVAIMLGRFFGEVAAIVDVKERRLAEENLKEAYGDTWSDMKINLVARECFTMLGLNAADVILSRKWTARELEELIDTEGMEHFDDAYARGKGVIGLTGHIGNFELMAAWYSSVKKIPLSVIGRQLYDKRLDQLIVNNRLRFGLENIPSDASAKKLLSVLKEGKMIGVLLDLDSRKVSGYFAPFFGRPANTAAGPVVIGRKTGSPVVPMAMFRQPDHRYLIKVLPWFEINNTEDKEADILDGLTRCNRALEELIDYDPTQWMWIHNRWKSQPEDVSGVEESVKEEGRSEPQL
jgi:KDO2-lipid IV(A) lauroyltransferase